MKYAQNSKRLFKNGKLQTKDIKAVLFLSSEKWSSIIVEKRSAQKRITSGNVVYLRGSKEQLCPQEKLSFRILRPSDGFFETTAFVTRDVQYVGLVRKAVNQCSSGYWGLRIF